MCFLSQSPDHNQEMFLPYSATTIFPIPFSHCPRTLLSLLIHCILLSAYMFYFQLGSEETMWHTHFSDSYWVNQCVTGPVTESQVQNLLSSNPIT